MFFVCLCFIPFSFPFPLSSSPSLSPSHPLLPCPFCNRLPHLLYLAPWWCVVISGGCWGSGPSCKWGSPPGWPRHSVVQVSKPVTLPTKQWWERQGPCVLTGTRHPKLFCNSWCKYKIIYFPHLGILGASDHSGNGQICKCHSQWTPGFLWFGCGLLFSHFIDLYFVLQRNLYNRSFSMLLRLMSLRLKPPNSVGVRI